MTIPLTIVDEAGSTSAILRKMAEAGAPEQALMARQQTAGRGRLGRAWRSVVGNLYCSALLRPSGTFEPGHWSLLSAVALADALEAVMPPIAVLGLKWPNDVLLDGGKLAGILLEAGAGWVVIGFGVNLAGRPEGLDRPVACVADVAAPPMPDAFALTLLTALAAWRARYMTKGFGPVRAAWCARGPAEGAPVGVLQGPARIDGRFRGIGGNGALLLSTDGGDRAVTFGDVV